MKYLILILLGIALLSCGNKKAAIVEQIKIHKDSLIIAEMASSGFDHAAQHVLLYKKLTDVDDKFLKEQKYSGGLTSKSLDSMHLLWWVKSLKSKSVIDSLELELKKY